MAALGDAFKELKRRAEVVGLSEEEYLSNLLAREELLEGRWSVEDWRRVLEPAEKDIAEGRLTDGRVARERMSEYMREKRES